MSAGAALAAMRRRSEKVCPHCGGEFLGLATQIYCTTAHRKDAFRARHRAENTESRPGQA